MSQNIRNFVIIAHIDHGKSTLADRLLELTGAIEKRKMREQFLDLHPLEREKGITIKMQPVRMLWHSDRRITQNGTQNNAENYFLYENLTYKIRGALFQVRKKIGLGHKEQVYHNALEIELENAGVRFESKKNIPILYEGKSVGIYQPDFIVDGRVLVELKALPEIGKSQVEQLWSYLKGCDYKLALLVNFGSKDLEIKRVVYDKARAGNSFQRFSAFSQRESAQVENYILNLIDTPGHVDFSYEVSRALAAVEGAILLVDATQGVQAQTLANLHLAQKEKLVIIPALNKIDLPSAEIEKTAAEIVSLLGVRREEIFEVSAKTGAGVEELLKEVIKKVPPPAAKFKSLKVSEKDAPLRALIFDSFYDPYQGVVAHVRIFDGVLQKGNSLFFMRTRAKCEALESGVFLPERSAVPKLGAGEIGYVATGIKEPEKVRVGDTITEFKNLNLEGVPPLSGYQEPQPMIFASIFPENQDDYPALRESLEKLKLNDAAVTFEPEESGALGRGMRTGFLGMLHLEIISERLRREYGLNLIFSNPSVSFRIKIRKGGLIFIYSAVRLPEAGEIEHWEEPWVRLEIITPANFLGVINSLLNEHNGKIVDTSTLTGERLLIKGEAPLREIIIDFYDKLKSVTQGFASMSYELTDYRRSDLLRLDILAAGEKIPALSEIVPRQKAYFIGRERVKKLKELLPRELFAVALQAEVEGKIIARETIPALKKDVTGYLYGGDRTRKMKLWKKQQRGKKKLKEAGRVAIPPEVFLKMLKK